MTALSLPRHRRGGGEQGLLAGFVVLLAVVSLLPMARLLWEGVAPGGVPQLGVMSEVLSARSTWRATGNSLEAALGGMVLSLLLGSLFALLVALTDLRAKPALVFCFLLPLMIPPQITALSWAQLFGPASPLLNSLGLAPPPGSPHPLYSPGGVILLLGIQHAPLVFLSLRAGLRVLPREQVEAARAAGAGRWQVLLTIVLPLMTPPLVAGAALAFVSAIGNFGIPALLGIPAGYTVLPTLIYQRLSSFGPSVISEVAVLSILVGLIAAGGLVLQSLVLRRRDYRSFTAVSQLLSYRLGRWRAVVEAGCWGIIALILILPLIALAASSLVTAYGVPLGPDTVTLDNYREVLFRQPVTIRAFANSFFLAGTAAVVLVAVSGPLAYFLVWRRAPLLRALDLVAELPYALPGVVLAIACILVFLKPLPILGVSLYGTLWIILFAYLARFLTLALRPTVAAFHQLDRSLEEAAQAAGARFLRRLRDIVLPLVAPAAAAGGLLVFMTAFNELTVSALLWSGGTETLGVVVFSLDDGGSTVLASAVAMVAVAAIVGLMVLVQLLASRLPPGVLPWGR